MLKKFLIILILIYINIAFAGIFNRGSDSSSDESGGIISRRLNNHTSHISSETKENAKAVACATAGKGICMGVAGVKYMKKEISESNNLSESSSKSKTN